MKKKKKLRGSSMSGCRAALRKLKRQLEKLTKKGHNIMIDQATFETDLKAFLTGVGDLITAIENKIANTPAADFTADDQAVQASAVNVATEINKLNPPTPVPIPASLKHKHGK